MKVHCKLSILILFVLGALSAVSLRAVAADPATPQINAEIARLQQ